MKILLLFLIFLFPIFFFGQNSTGYETKFEYYDNGSVKMEYKEYNGQKVDTLKAYDMKGRLEAILYFGDYGSTEPVFREDYFYNGASRKMTG